MLEGSVRTFSKEDLNNIESKMKCINAGLESSYNCKIDWKCENVYPAVINDVDLYKKFESIQDDKYMKLQTPYMLAEDFSYYQQQIPGVFFFLGTKTKEYSSGLHTATFNFNETVLSKAVDIYYTIITKL